VKGVLEDGNTGNRLIVVHAGSDDGCIAGSHLLTEQGQLTSAT